MFCKVYLERRVEAIISLKYHSVEIFIFLETGNPFVMCFEALTLTSLSYLQTGYHKLVGRRDNVILVLQSGATHNKLDVKFFYSL